MCWTGAGVDLAAAEAPAAPAMQGGGRVLVFGLGTGSSGIPSDWAAGKGLSGVALLEDLSRRELTRIGSRVRAVRRPGDIVVASIHWGGNWGYAVPAEQQAFAHGLIDEAGIDLVHGHSSHHPKAIEVHAGRAILYGCGDRLNDYEEISGHEAF
jgi:poly-gamma-glutamate synthesis protein (capsule biosynthesis protein)